MSTRKTTLNSPTAAQGTKLENASTPTSKSLEKNSAGSLTADKADMGANASHTNIVNNNTSEPKATEQTQKSSQHENKPFQQRVTRNSPLLLASPNVGITIKKEPLDFNDHHTNSESEEVDGINSSTKKTNARGRKNLKEHKDLADKEKEEKLEESENKNKEKEEKEKEKHIDSKEKDSSANVTNTNRLTRKSLANQEAAKIRVTRQRQSSGASTRSETPPARGRGRGLGRGKMPVQIADPSSTLTKRKRSVDIDNSASHKSSVDEPGPKYIKIEVKDPEFENEEVLLSSQNTNASSENSEMPLIKIKQELIDESENEISTLAETTSNTTTPVTASLSSATATLAVGRGRGRNPNRKSTTNSKDSAAINNHSSPSTRATRQTKHNSPVQTTTEPKRKRMGSQTRSLLKTNASSNSKIQLTNAEDEDSKESMASTNTDDIVLALIKSEKISMEMDDDNTVDDNRDMLAEAEKNSNETLTNVEETSDLPVPLVVDTDVAPAINNENSEVTHSSALTPIAASCSSVASGSEKAASLSPSELVSEGVSEISVKQFYKKPKFLENNLGIEEDPKLGNIVQKVVGLETATTSSSITPALLNTLSTTAAEDTAITNLPINAEITGETLLDDTSSEDSLKEGTLQFDESVEDKKSLAQNDCNSLSSDDIETPLLIVEDEEEGEEVEEEILGQLIGVNNDEKLPSKEHILETPNKTEEAREIEMDNDQQKLSEKEVDEEEDNEKAIELDDDLTLEESETISMDNNASINDEIVTEIEEPNNEIEELTNFNEGSENKNSAPKDIVQQNDNQNAANKSVEVFANGKASDPTDIFKAEIKQTALETTATKANNDDDNDVLAKIDAELKKIDERSKEKLLICNVNNNKLSLINDSTTLEPPMVTIIMAAKTMDIDKEIKPNVSHKEAVAEVQNVIKDEPIVEDVLGIKLDVEQPLFITENIKLTDAKLQLDDDVKNDGDCNSDLNILIKGEKTEKRKLLKSSISDIEQENVNGKPTLTSSSECSSPLKTGSAVTMKDDDTTSMKSGQSTTSWITLDLENDDQEILRKKELHLQNLGLVTHQAAEKRRQEVIQSSAANVEASKVAATQQHHQNNKRNGKNSSHAASTHQEYTGTLKTIIKINRNSTGGGTSTGNNGRKNQNNTTTSNTTTKEQQQQQRRQPLKMTFQKGRARAHGTSNNDRSHQDREGHVEDYYTIQNETEETHEHAPGTSNKKEEKEEILIPEKASSFKFHPGRLCEDQCFYCSGKFGLYDTPCHVGQIKSMERQQKILANEEKLTVDNCLCDACFRHVDRRANVPSYKKRLSATGHLETSASATGKSLENAHYDEQQNNETDAHENLGTSPTVRKCLVPDCVHHAAHSLRRKCIRKSVKKFLLKFEIPTGAACVWLCQSHYDAVIQCSGCVLCKRRLGKNHMYHITSDTDRLEKALCEMGIPVQLGIGTAVCKLCRYFANLLMKPPDSTKSQKAEFVKNYRKRLLQFHNIHDGSNDASEADEDDSNSNTNTDNPELAEKSNILDTESDTQMKQQDDNTTSINLPETPTKTDNSSSSSSEKNINKSIERDFDTTGISTDSSNSSTVSNTATSSPAEMSKLKAILQSNATVEKRSTTPTNDISNVLRANPNISMRELFPGEEDLGLQFKVPFGGNSSQRTPEGWTRVQTFLQYDEPTRRLWEELQKPYGNQSSFLRHLILLEKYFRNGDLILSASASNNANVYTQTVRQRLTSYDKGHCGGLHIGTGVPRENKNAANSVAAVANVTPGCSKSSTSKTKELDPKIPTFVINEDDDDEEDSEDQDVEMTSVEKLPKKLNSSASVSALQKESINVQQNKQQLQRSRSLSVDKLTKQLSSNAVTITARPKDPALAATNSKRATPSPQKSLLKDNLMQPSNNSATVTTSANLAAANAAAAVALAASTALTASGGGPSNSRSILKCNLLGINKSVEILPISSSSTNTTITKTSTSSTNVPLPPPPPPAPLVAQPTPPVPVAETKQQKILDVANKLLGNHLEAAANNQNKNQGSLLSSPPELVSLQRRSTGQLNASANSNNNGNSNSNNNNSNHHNQQPSNLPKRPQLLVKPGTSRPPPNVVILPDTLTPQERLQSKTWRPTLMPVEENHNLLTKNGPLYQTADGRRLPALVQVQSGGKPFLISIFDYNRMCILRREKLMRDQMLKATKKRLESKQQQQQQQQQQQHHQQQQQQHHQQQQQQHHAQQQQQQHLQNQQHQHQQHQLQKSNLHNMNKNSNAAVNQQRQHQHQQQQQQQHQQQQNAEQQRLLQYQLLEHQQALLKAAANALQTNSQHAAAAAALRYQSILPKPPATSNITTMPPLQAPLNTNANFSAPMMPLLANAITNAANSGNVNPASSATPTHNNSSWLWNNFPDANQLLLNGGASVPNAAGNANVPKLPQLLAKPNNPASTLTNASNAAKLQQQQLQHQQQQYLLSKIPKSLTVIPQHKLMNNNNTNNTGSVSGQTSVNLMKE